MTFAEFRYYFRNEIMHEEAFGKNEKHRHER